MISEIFMGSSTKLGSSKRLPVGPGFWGCCLSHLRSSTSLAVEVLEALGSLDWFRRIFDRDVWCVVCITTSRQERYCYSIVIYSTITGTSMTPINRKISIRHHKFTLHYTKAIHVLYLLSSLKPVECVDFTIVPRSSKNFLGRPNDCNDTTFGHRISLGSISLGSTLEQNTKYSRAEYMCHCDSMFILIGQNGDEQE
jgi:hypothetical protein